MKSSHLLVQINNQSYTYTITCEQIFHPSLAEAADVRPYLADIVRNGHLVFKVRGEGFVLGHW